MEKKNLLLILYMFFSVIVFAGKKDGRNDVACPKLITTINGVTVNSNNDGVPDRGSITVCNNSNISFGAFSDANGSTNPNIKVYQTILRNNVTVPFCTKCSAKIGAFEGSKGTAALIDAAKPGYLVMIFQSFIDDNNNGSVDANECAGDSVIYTVTVSLNLVTNINGTTANSKDNASVAFTACNKPDNITFGPFTDANGSTDPRLKVYQTTQLTNVTAPFCNNCSAPIGAFDKQKGTAALIDTSKSGILVMTFRAFIDSNKNGAIDGNEACTPDGLVTYTITVSKQLTLGSCTKTDATCYRSSDGSVTAGTVSNAVGDVSYKWVDSLGKVVGTTSTVNNLPAGLYTLTVSDNCFSKTCQVMINQPKPIHLYTTINDRVIETHHDGDTDRAFLAVCNKTDNVIFGLFKDANGSSDPLLKVYQTTELSNVTAPFCNNCSAKIGAFEGAKGTVALVNTSQPGMLTMRFRAFIDANNNGKIDANECTSDVNVYRIRVGQLTLGSCSWTDAYCGNNNGSATAGAVSNAVGDVRYRWVNSAGNFVGRTPTISNLPPGDYTLTVSDNCFTRTCQVTIKEVSSTLRGGNITMSPETPVPGQKRFTIYRGYGPQCATLTAPPVSGGTAPYSYRWNTGATSSSIQACPTRTTTYTVVITDKNGCRLVRRFTINVIDVRCGKNLERIVICENGHETECVPRGQVQRHLRNGDKLGYCPGDHNIDEYYRPLPDEKAAPVITYKVTTYPNPFTASTTIQYSLPYDSKVSLKVYDVMGREVSTLVDGYKTSGNYTVEFNPANSGNYYYRLNAVAKEKVFNQMGKMIKLK